MVNVFMLLIVILLTSNTFASDSQMYNKVKDTQVMKMVYVCIQDVALGYKDCVLKERLGDAVNPSQQEYRSLDECLTACGGISYVAYRCPVTRQIYNNLALCNSNCKESCPGSSSPTCFIYRPCERVYATYY